MIYVDASVALAHVFAENRAPETAFWDEELGSSRLLEYELWNRVHARRLASSHGDSVRTLIARMSLFELTPSVLARAMEPFPVPLRMLDALHLASAHFLNAQGQHVEIATYDGRMAAAAKAIGLAVVAL